MDCTMSIKIAHFSDLHYADETLAEVERCFSSAVDQAIAACVDAAMITGDSTDHALNAHSPAVIALARQVQRLADHCPVLMLQGTYSHEPPGFLSLFPLLHAKHPICIAERLQQVALVHTGRWIVSDGWKFDTLPRDIQVLCTCMPTLNRAVLAGSAAAGSAIGAMGNQLARVLAGYAPGHLAARQSGVPVVLLSHGTTHGCLTEHGVPMAGADHEFSPGELFSSEAVAVMLGHIHKHQSWVNEGQRVAYAGSIGRLHYGEVDPKGFLLWEVSATHAQADLHCTPARRTLDIEFDGPPDMHKLSELASSSDLQDTWVRIRWQVLEEECDLVNRAGIEAIMARAAGLKLEGRIVPIVRSRASGIARELSLPRQIEHWATLANVDKSELLACWEELRVSSPETIAMQVIKRATPPGASSDAEDRIPHHAAA
jgi:exonuclease SbcD